MTLAEEQRAIIASRVTAREMSEYDRHITQREWDTMLNASRRKVTETHARYLTPNDILAHDMAGRSRVVPMGPITVPLTIQTVERDAVVTIPMVTLDSLPYVKPPLTARFMRGWFWLARTWIRTTRVFR